MAAAQNGHVEVIRLLLERDAVIDPSALVLASSEGHVGVINLLLERQANINATGIYGYTPLDAAAEDGHVEIVKTLLTHKSFNTVHDKRTLCGTIANTLAYYGHTDLLQYIVKHKNVDLRTSDTSKRTPLLFAARGGHVETFEYLVGHGLPLGAIDAKGDGLISYAASSGNPQLLDMALSQDFKFSSQSGHWSPLHWACRSGNVQIVEKIVEAMTGRDWRREPITKAYAEGEWTHKWTPRAIAIFHGSEKMPGDLSEANQAALGACNAIFHAQANLTEAACDFCFHVSKRPISL